MRYEEICKRIAQIESDLSCEYSEELEDELLELEFELAGYHVGG